MQQVDTNPRPHLMICLIVVALVALVAYRVLASRPSTLGGVPISALAILRSEGAWNAPGNTVFARELLVDLGSKRAISGIDISLDNNDTYRIETGSGGKFLPLHTIVPVAGHGLARHRVELPAPTAPASHLRIVALSGDGMYALGHLLVW